MVFSVLVSADLYGVKMNYELQFGSVPTFVEFKAKTEAVLASESSLRRPAGYPVEPFIPERMQIFVETAGAESWMDLVSATQITEYAQVYVFQREGPLHKEVQSKIPPPSKTIATSSHLLTSSSPVRSPPYTEYSLPPPQIERNDVASFSEKARYVYSLLDIEKNDAVTEERFATVMGDKNVVFAEGVVGGLFAKCDANGDGCIQPGEWQRFAELYPTLLDSLYYRGRDDEEEMRHEQRIADAQRQLDDAEANLGLSQTAVTDASENTVASAAAVAEAAEIVHEAESLERDTQAALDTAQTETSSIRQAVSHRAQDVAQAKESFRRATTTKDNAEQTVSSAESTLAEQTSVRERAEQRLEDIRELLRQQEVEVEQQKRAEWTCSDDLVQTKAARDKAAADVEDADTHLKATQDHLQVSEGELGEAQTRQCEKGVTHLQAKDAVSQAKARRDATEREERTAKDNEATKKRLLEDAQQHLSARKGVHTDLLSERDDMKAKRKDSEEEERPLLDEEVRLRSQRDALEQQEAALRKNHSSYHSSKGRAVSVSQHSPSPARHSSASPM